MDWVIEHGQQIVMVVSLALVALTWGYVSYWGKRDRLLRDLERLVGEGLEYLKAWAKDRLEAVTTDDVAEVSDWLYDHYVAGTALAKLVTRERMYALLLEAFVRWRDRFAAMDQAMMAYSVGPGVTKYRPGAGLGGG